MKDFLRVCIGRICMRFFDRKFFKRFLRVRMGYLIENFFKRFSKSSYGKGSYGISDRKFF